MSLDNGKAQLMAKLDDCTWAGEWPEKHILGGPPGPNENGRHWPSRRQREHAAQ
jgi:hypothetical protein